MTQLLTRQDMSKMRSAQWRDLLASLGVKVATSISDIVHTGQLFVTNCCGTKGVDLLYGTPDVFYLGDKQQLMIRRMREERYDWAILSDLYGIHFADEALPLYDIHPGQLTQSTLWDKGIQIRAKMIDRYPDGLPAVVYVKGHPSTAVPYLIMLLAAGVDLTMCLSPNRK